MQRLIYLNLYIGEERAETNPASSSKNAQSSPVLRSGKRAHAYHINSAGLNHSSATFK